MARPMLRFLPLFIGPLFVPVLLGATYAIAISLLRTAHSRGALVAALGGWAIASTSWCLLIKRSVGRPPFACKPGGCCAFVCHPFHERLCCPSVVHCQIVFTSGDVDCITPGGRSHPSRRSNPRIGS